MLVMESILAKSLLQQRMFAKIRLKTYLFGILSSVFDHPRNLGPSLCPFLCEGSVFILCSDNPVLSMEEYIRHL